MSPAEVTAILQQLDDRQQFPLCVFTNVRDLPGRPGHAVVSNLMAGRRRLALAMGLAPERYRNELAMEVDRWSGQAIKPEIIPRRNAPAMAVVREGDAVDLFDLPVIRQHEMDGGQGAVSYLADLQGERTPGAPFVLQYPVLEVEPQPQDAGLRLDDDVEDERLPQPLELMGRRVRGCQAGQHESVNAQRRAAPVAASGGWSR